MPGTVQTVTDGDQIQYYGQGWDPGAKILLTHDFKPADPKATGTSGGATSSIAGNGTFYIGFGKNEVSHGQKGTLTWDVHESSASGTIDL